MPGLVCKPTPLSYSVPVRRPLLRISERNLLASAANGRGFFALWCRFIAAWWDVQRVSPSARRAFASRNSYLASMNCLNELPETRKAKPKYFAERRYQEAAVFGRSLATSFQPPMRECRGTDRC